MREPRPGGTGLGQRAAAFWVSCRAMLPRILLAATLLAACGADAPPPTAAAPDPAGPAARTEPAVVAAVPGLSRSASHVLAGTSDAADAAALAAAPAEAAAALLAAVPGLSPVELGRVPAALAALGDRALPALTGALRAPAPEQRRVAALTLLQLADGLRDAGRADAVLPALAAAAGDDDPAVRAAAELARRRVAGDTSDLDRSRASHDAAVRGAR